MTRIISVDSPSSRRRIRGSSRGMGDRTFRRSRRSLFRNDRMPAMHTRFLLFVVAGIAALGWYMPVQGAPRLPQNEDEVLERLRDRPLDARARELRKLRAELAGAPQNLALATQIARRYVEEAR